MASRRELSVLLATLEIARAAPGTTAPSAPRRARPRPRLRSLDATFVAPAQLGRDGVAAQHGVDRFSHVRVNRHSVARLDLDHDVERGRRLALEHALLGPASARFVVAESDALDAADQVGERTGSRPSAAEGGGA